MIEPSGVASPSGVLEALESAHAGPATVVGIISFVEATTHDIAHKLEQYGANILIVPRKHIASLLELTDFDLPVMARMVRRPLGERAVPQEKAAAGPRAAFVGGDPPASRRGNRGDRREVALATHRRV